MLQAAPAASCWPQVVPEAIEKLGSPLSAGLMVNIAVPALVTTTAVWVSVLLTRLSPKLKDVVLNVAMVTGEAIVNDTAALCIRSPDVPVRVMLAVPGLAAEEAEMLN
jgi:hypothetical protein